MAGTRYPLKVFLSYAHEDKLQVRGLFQDLHRDGFDVWFDEESLLPGEPWKQTTEDAVRKADVAIICLSTKATTKEGYFQKEIRIALEVAQEKPLDSIYLIPVRLEECIIPPQLSVWHCADLFTDGYRKLLASIKTKEDAKNVALSNTPPLMEYLKNQTGRHLFSKRRETIRNNHFERLYHFENATSPAIRLIGAGTEWFSPQDIFVVTKNQPYMFPKKYLALYNELIAYLIEEAKEKHKSIFNGPAVRMLNYQILTPNPSTEKKALRLVLGPLMYFDYAIVRRLSDATLEDDGIDNIDDFVDIEKIASGGDFSASSLSNIVDTVTTIVSNDGYLFFSRRGTQVSDRGGWHTSAVAEGIQAAKDQIDFSSDNERIGTPFQTVIRGITEEFSPKLIDALNSTGSKDNLRMLGMSYDLEGFHPDLIFFLAIPLPYSDIMKICRDFPGVDSPIEGTLRAINVSNNTQEIVKQLATFNWTPGGAASVIRSLEYLSSIAMENKFETLQQSIEWVIAGNK